MTEETRFVIDASVIVKWLNQEREPDSDRALDILHRASSKMLSLYTSDLAVHEVLNALIRGKGIRGHILQDAIESFFMLPLIILATDFTAAATAAVIAQQHALTFYDAMYMALAFDMGCPLITANTKHQKSLAEIIVLPLSQWK